MPPTSTKRKRLPFNPPRRSSPAKRTATSKTATSRAAAPTTHRSSSLSSTQDQQSIPHSDQPSQSVSVSPERTLVPASPTGSQSRSRSRSRSSLSPSPSEHHHDSPPPSGSLSPEPEYILAEITTEDTNRNNDPATSEPLISPKLLTTLLHHHFREDKTRITKDANRVFAKYVDIFIREAVARAVYERKEKLNTDGVDRSRIRTMLDSVLEVEDLEKLTPQLLLDF